MISVVGEITDMTTVTRSNKSTNDIDVGIGLKIETLRTALSITRKELAQKLGITHQQLQKYEKGLNRISASRLVDVANILGVSVIHFYEDFMTNLAPDQIEKERACYEIMYNFINIKRPEQQEAVRKLVKILAEGGEI